jgi:hypothetical protein
MKRTICRVLAWLAIAAGAFGRICWAGAEPVAVPEITSESEQGFHDLVFAITKYELSADNAQVLRATAKRGAQTLAFEVSLPTKWESLSTPGVPVVVNRGAVDLRAIPRESDAFIRVLDAIYETKMKPIGMKASTRFAGISLEGNPARLKDGPVKLKLFFESGRQDRYAEVFLNIELAKGRLYLREKDPEYRKAMVAALGNFVGRAVQQGVEPDGRSPAAPARRLTP